MTIGERGSSLDDMLLYMYVAERGHPEGRWADHGVLYDDLARRFNEQLVQDILWHPDNLAEYHCWAPKLQLVKLTDAGQRRGKVLAKGRADSARDQVDEALRAIPQRLEQFLFITAAEGRGIPDERGNWCVFGDTRVEAALAAWSDVGGELGLAIEVTDYVSSGGGGARDVLQVLAAELLDVSRDHAARYGQSQGLPADEDTYHRLYHLFEWLLAGKNYFTLSETRDAATELQLPFPVVRREVEALCEKGLVRQEKRRDMFLTERGDAQLFWIALQNAYLRPIADWLLLTPPSQ